MRLTPADWARIAGVIVGIGGAVNSQALEAMGVAPGAASHVVAIVGFIVLAVSIVSSKLALPSPPAGTNYAAIPQGTIPAVGTTTAPGLHVAHIDPATAQITTLQGANPDTR